MRRTPCLLLTTLLLLPAAVRAQEQQDPRELFERAYFQEHALKQLDQAIASYQRVAGLAATKDRELAGRALVRVAACEQARGRDVEARAVLDDVLQRFGDLPAVKQAAQQLLGENRGPRRSLRLYDVEELLTSAPDYPAPRVELAPGLTRPLQPTEGPGVLSFDEGPDVPEGRSLEPDQLEELITRNVAEDSWANDRNSIQIEAGRLIVTQTADVQAQIAAYLERLRAQRGRVLTLEVTLALVEGARARQLAGASEAGPLAEAEAARLEQQLRAGEKGVRLLQRQRLTAYDRQTVHAAALRELAWVQQATELTGVVPVVHPVVRQGAEGLLVQLRPALVAPGQILLEIQAGYSEWAMRELQVVVGPLGQTIKEPLQLPRADRLQLDACQLQRLGATHLAGLIRVTRRFKGITEGFQEPYLAFLVRPELARLDTGKADAPASTEARLLRIHDVSLLTYQPSHCDDRTSDLDELENEGQALSSDTLLELVQRNVAPESWTSNLNSIAVQGEGALAVVNTPDVQAQVDAFLTTLRRGRGRSLQVETARLSLGAAELAQLLEAGQPAGPGAFVVPAAAAEALLNDPQRLLGSAVASTWEGHRVCLFLRGHTAYLADYFRASGGTGSVIQVTQCPVSKVALEGENVEVRAKLLPDGKHASVHVLLELSDLEVQELATSAGPLELPRQHVRDHRCAVSFPIDQVLVVNAGVSDPADPLRGVVLVRVRAKNLLGGE